MSAKTTAFANALLLLLCNNTNIANIGDATGLRGSSTAGNLYWSLHSAEPTVGGSQTTNEVSYTEYARVASARNGTELVVTDNEVSPGTDRVFDERVQAGTVTATWFGLGVASSGAGLLLYRGELDPPIVIGPGVEPKIAAATSITEA